MKQTITFITSHSKKAEELSRYLQYSVDNYKLDLFEIQSLDPHRVATAKALEAYRILQRPVLVEDYSISFTALGKLPGTLTKWFLQELKPEGLCRLLDAYEDREASAQTCFALCVKGDVVLFDGIMKGTIVTKPRGEIGYGTDAIFIPEEWDKTWGEMTYEEQAETSLRRIALEKLEKYLQA